MIFIELCLEPAEILKGCQGSQVEKKMKNNLNNPRQTEKKYLEQLLFFSLQDGLSFL